MIFHITLVIWVRWCDHSVRHYKNLFNDKKFDDKFSDSIIVPCSDTIVSYILDDSILSDIDDVLKLFLFGNVLNLF